MDSSKVQSDQVHQNDEQHHDSQQETHGAEEVAHHPDNEKNSYMTRVKAKARKIKDSIKKHYGHDDGSSNEHQQHTPDHHDDHLDEQEDKEMLEDPEVHEAPIKEREVVKSATPASEQVETLDKPGSDFEGTKVLREELHKDSLVEGVSSTNEINQKDQNIGTTDPAKTFIEEEKQEVLEEDPHEKGSRPEEYTLSNYQTNDADRSGTGNDEIKDITPVEEPHYDPLVEGDNSTTEINQNIATDPTKTFAAEEKPEQFKFNLEKPIVLEENAQEQGNRAETYPHPNYQTNVTDAGRDGSDEIKDFTEVEESFERMNVHDEPAVADTEYPPAKNHDQSVPHLSAETRTHNEYPHETLYTDINRNPEIPSETRETSNTITNFNSEAVKKDATPPFEQVENLEKSGIDFEGTKAVGEGHHQSPLAEEFSSTTEINQKPEQYNINLEKPIVLQEDSHEQGSRPEAYDIPNYQTKVTDPSGAGSDEIKDFTEVEESFERMNVHDGPTVADTEYPPAKNHDQSVPHLSAETKTLNEYPQETLSTDINRNPEIPSETRETFNTLTNFNNEAVKENATPALGQVENIEKSGIDFEGNKSVGEGHHQYPLAEGFSSTTEINQKPEQYNVNSEKPKVLQEDPHEQGSRPEAYDLPNYQTEGTDPSGAGSDEIKGTTTNEESFERLNVNNEPTVVHNEYPLDKNHDEFVPHLSGATKTQNEYPQDTVSTDINTNPEIPSETRETFNNFTTSVEEKEPPNESVETQSKHKNYTDETEILPTSSDVTHSPENSEASRLGYDEKGDRNTKVEIHDEKEETENASNMSGSNVEYEKNIVPSVTENLAPVHAKDAEEGSVVESKEYGTSTGSSGVETGTKNKVKDDHDKGVSMKEYLAEKLKPGKEDKALSEVISEALHKPKEEPVKKEQGDLGSEDEKAEKASEESYYGKMKGVVGSWFAKSEENQSPHGSSFSSSICKMFCYISLIIILILRLLIDIVAGGEDISKTKNSVAEVERVGQVEDEPRKQE